MKFIYSLALLLFFSGAHAFTFTKEVSEAELQAQVDKMMPFERKTVLATITVSEPLVDLFEGENKVGISGRIDTLAPNGLKGSGTISVVGTVVYVRSEGAFYIKDSEVVSLDINGLTEPVVQFIKPYAQALISSALAVTPVFVLDESDAQQKLAKSTLESIVVRDEKLLIKIKAFQ